MKALFLLLLTIPAQASWHYNENGGFGIYQPEGWQSSILGRSSTLTGPETDRAQSEIFLGSDWVSKVENTSKLEAYVKKETGDASPRPIEISGLAGFQAGKGPKGAIYLLRIPGNVIVVRYELKGSKAQIDEGETMLSSIEVRTKGIENQKK